MGKHKAFKMRKIHPTVGVLETMPRADLQQIIQESLETLKPAPDQALVNELLLMAATVERVAWGEWIVRPHGQPELTCGCAVASVCDLVSFNEYLKHPSEPVPSSGGFITAYDRRMKRRFDAPIGVAQIID